MDNLDDLKAIWHIAKTDSLPNSSEMMQIIKKFRSQKLRNKWIMIVYSLIMAALIIGALFLANFKFATTYVGGGLIALSALWRAITEIRSLKRFYQLDDCSNVDFLSFIEQTRQNQIYFYKKTMAIIIALCTFGLMLYLYESIYQHPIWLGGIYALVLTYFAVLWFVVRPRSFKKHADKLNATKERMENILKQLK